MQETPANAWAGPLQGVRVLDFTRVLSGPAAAQALADLGAEVLKVEPPGIGDDTRLFPPFREDVSHYFLSVNRGKKSIVIDLKTEAGVKLVLELADKCDILIENYRPGVMERLGLGYAALAARNPRLIYCAISGFGLTGPMRDLPAFDIVLQALSGAFSINGEAGRPPVRLGIPLGDMVGGVKGPIGILAALYERERTKRGRLIDVSLLDGLIGMLGYFPQLAFFTGADPKPQGNEHSNLVPYGAFPAKDGSIIVACLTNGFWKHICEALGMPEMVDDPRFFGFEQRRDNRRIVNEMICAFTSMRDVGELVALFTEHQVPHAPILGVMNALAQPQAVAREMVVEADHLVLGKIPIVNRPIKFPGSAQPVPTAPPVLGEHTDAILRDVLGLNEAEIARLRERKVVS
jgi:crotonobetainyl-CoA:carnitine CoA-transferase CaiB-like acyl-CoA transferase